MSGVTLTAAQSWAVLAITVSLGIGIVKVAIEWAKRGDPR